jgi:hypothetical protein
MNNLSLSFPETSVVWAPGDFLICRCRPGERGRVYRVEDLLLAKRLIPHLPDPSTLSIEEHLLDSMAPAYFNEVQLLLTAFDPEFANEQEALQAIYGHTLTERAKGLLRAAREFTQSHCRAVHPANPS